MNRSIILTILIPLGVLAVFAGLNFLPAYQTAERRTYDLLLHVKKPVKEDPRILLFDVDDLAISKVGTWPWSRDKMATGLALLSEFDAAKVVFDIVYEQSSPLAVDSDVLTQTIPQEFQNQFQSITSNISALFDALQNGTVTLSQAHDFVNDLVGLTDKAKTTLLQEVDRVARDNDQLLGNSARMFGGAYFTVDALDTHDSSVTDEQRSYAVDHFTVRNIKVFDDSNVPKAQDIVPAILPILHGAEGAGFPRVEVDEDGVRRRINLLYYYRGHYFPQLVFGPLLDWLGDPTVEVRRQSITLDNAVYPGTNRPVTVRIPLTGDGTFLINWPPKTFVNSFKHLSYYYLIYHDRLENDLVHNLRIMNDAGYLSLYRGEQPLLDSYDQAAKLKPILYADPNDRERAQYRDLRKTFFSNVGVFLNGGAEDELLKQIDSALSTPGITDEQKSQYEGIRNDVQNVFESTGGIYKNLMAVRDTLQKTVPGRFVIVGQTGTSTTDRGVNPFDKAYDNVGTHASIVNTVLQRQFLDDAPWWVAFLLAVVLAFAVSFVIRTLTGPIALTVGIGTTFLVGAAEAGLFLITGTYLNILTPMLAVAATFILLTMEKFLTVGRERNYIRSAFGHYLSDDVINLILEDPEMLSLGGDERELTALFTDIRGFSTISEALDPQDLVRLLNQYLTAMSDVILQYRGTIDKFEGDAIISFFGAPADIGNHAIAACNSALRMRQTETELNRKFLEQNITPTSLLTRIGINTGEMVVGNMGTSNRMDYTIMGHAVNLAARLEGVNKQYGTWILISENTYKATDRAFAVRRLDRVRVVGVREPIRLYELIGQRDGISEQTISLLRKFNAGLNAFEAKDWDGARKEFQELNAEAPNDGPTDYYLRRCEEFKRKPPASDWDGVFNLSAK